MTKIRMDWKRLELIAEGHAGGGPRGKNIICAGISALTMALLNQLLVDEQNRTEWSMDEEAGYIRIRTDPPDNFRPRIRNYYEVIMTGLQAWAQAFPQNIRIEEDNGDGAV